jgi:hypothetical protein
MAGSVRVEACFALVLREVPAARGCAGVVPGRDRHEVDEERIVSERHGPLGVTNRDLPATEYWRVAWGQVQAAAPKAGGDAVGG